jgi:hypothetical protein
VETQVRPNNGKNLTFLTFCHFAIVEGSVDFCVIGLLSKDRVQLIIQCPFCGEIHLHGAGQADGPIAYGSRVPHCQEIAKTSNSYTIVPAPSIEVEDVLRANLKRRAAKKGVQL